MHDAPRIGTVSQPEGMPQLMNSFFGGSFEEKDSVFGQTVETLAQAGQRDDGKVTFEFGLAKDKVELGNIEVNITDGQDSLTPSRAECLAQPAQDG